MGASGIGRRAALLGSCAAALAGCGGRAEGTVLPDVEVPGLPEFVGRNGWPVPGLAAGDLLGGVSLLNVWATWCPPCREEHPHLVRLSADRRFRKVGILHKDQPARAIDFLRRAGNPYDAVVLDDGRFSRGLGETAVPVSYVVDRTARIAFKFRGSLDEGSIERRLRPALEAALQASAGIG